MELRKEEIEKLIHDFAKWVKDETQIEIKGDYAVIDTPFMDPLNDLIQLYLKKRDGDSWVLSDMGHTLQNLKLMEVKIDRVYPIIQEIRRINGVQLEDGEILTEFKTKDFAQKKFDLLNAIIHISDLYELRSSGRINIFKQIVLEFFEEESIPITPDIRITGKTGLNHHFDFAIPKLNGKPEKLAKIINSPTKKVVETFLFELVDVRAMRKPGTKGLAVLNDEKPVSSDLIVAMKETDVIPGEWSKKKNFINQLKVI